jgi:hypothetical protein
LELRSPSGDREAGRLEGAIGWHEARWLAFKQNKNKLSITLQKNRQGGKAKLEAQPLNCIEIRHSALSIGLGSR